MAAKLLGGAIITLACALFGLKAGDGYHIRLNALENFSRGLLALKSEIVFSKTKLADALYNAAALTSDAPAAFFENAALSLNNGERLCKAWSGGLPKLRPALTISDLAQIERVGTALSSPDETVSAGAIEAFKLYAEGEGERIKRESEKNVKLYRSLGVLGGLLIAVVMM